MPLNDQASAAALQKARLIDQDGVVGSTTMQNRRDKAVGLEAIVGPRLVVGLNYPVGSSKTTMTKYATTRSSASRRQCSSRLPIPATIHPCRGRLAAGRAMPLAAIGAKKRLIPLPLLAL